MTDESIGDLIRAAARDPLSVDATDALVLLRLVADALRTGELVETSRIGSAEALAAAEAAHVRRVP